MQNIKQGRSLSLSDVIRVPFQQKLESWLSVNYPELLP